MDVDQSPETVRKGMSVVSESIESQSRLIDDLVDVSRFTSSEIRLEPARVDLRQLLAKTIDELRPSVEPDLAIVVRVEEADYSANADPLRVQQIIRNLVSNAHRYTPKGGTVHVALQPQDNFARLTVEDTGKGLAEDEIGRVFEPFWRADKNLPGLGVGLSIVSALVEAHGGTIEVHSDGPGCGSTFIVCIPMDAQVRDSVALHNNAAGDKANGETGPRA